MVDCVACLAPLEEAGGDVYTLIVCPGGTVTTVDIRRKASMSTIPKRCNTYLNTACVILFLMLLLKKKKKKKKNTKAEFGAALFQTDQKRTETDTFLNSH